MLNRRFQTRRSRRLIGGAVAVSLLAASGVLVGVGLASSPKIALDLLTVSTGTTTTVPTSGKVTICHKTHSKKNPSVTISINVHAWPAHARHGDTLGRCVRPTTTTGTTTGSAAPTAAPTGNAPGHSGEQHGQGNGQGNGHGNGQGQGQGKGHNR